MIPITPGFAIDEAALEERFIRASGAGGQNIQKVSSAVQLRFDAAGAADLPDYAYDNLRRLAGRRLAKDGFLTILAQRFRTQERNREDALARLTELLRAALLPPVPRRATRPSRNSIKRRLTEKRERATLKQQRRPPADC